MMNPFSRACAVAGCGQPAVASRLRCLAHGGERQPWQPTQPVTRIRGRKLQALRMHLFMREPFCRICATAGRMTLAAVRDHITPLAEGGQDNDSNVQPLCQSCSDIKTHTESVRGQRRAR
jgi:5-methylcytosine-specific restriction protein A